MRDRLIELVRKGVLHAQDNINDYGCFTYEDVADYLLENGVIVPPCKINDDLWWINEYKQICKDEKGIRGIAYFGDGKFKVIDKDGYTDELGTQFAYLSREEAEKALKGGAE